MRAPCGARGGRVRLRFGARASLHPSCGRMATTNGGPTYTRIGERAGQVSRYVVAMQLQHDCAPPGRPLTGAPRPPPFGPGLMTDAPPDRFRCSPRSGMECHGRSLPAGPLAPASRASPRGPLSPLARAGRVSPGAVRFVAADFGPYDATRAPRKGGLCASGARQAGDGHVRTPGLPGNRTRRPVPAGQHGDGNGRLHPGLLRVVGGPACPLHRVAHLGQ